MAQTWTDTTYKLDGSEMTIVTTHEGFNQVSLYIPGYSLDGRGFSIYFSIDHLQLLEDLVAKLKGMATSPNPPSVRLQDSPSPLPRAIAKIPELVN